MFFCLALPAAQAVHGCVCVFLMCMPSCFAVSHVAASLMWPRQSCTCWKVTAVLLLLSSAATFPHLTLSSSCYVHCKHATFWCFDLDIAPDCSAALGDPQAVLVAAEHPPLKLHLGDAKQVEGG